MGGVEWVYEGGACTEEGAALAWGALVGECKGSVGVWT